jgi:putative transposase
MSRLPRIVVPGETLHIMHRGNNRQDIFHSEEDRVRFKGDLLISLKKADCSLHAYVIMDNHFHLLVTPKNRTELAKFMQSVANRYVRYFNAKYHRTGTIWEGRFRSCLIDSERYLFTLYRYIEMNPVRAGMVESTMDYPWSSYHYHALGKPDLLITEHMLYKSLGDDTAQRCSRYRQISDQPGNQATETSITEATLKGEVFGSAQFHKKMGQLLNRATRLGKHGGDRKSQAYQNRAGSSPWSS